MHVSSDLLTECAENVYQALLTIHAGNIENDAFNIIRLNNWLCLYTYINMSECLNLAVFICFDVSQFLNVLLVWDSTGGLAGMAGVVVLICFNCLSCFIPQSTQSAPPTKPKQHLKQVQQLRQVATHIFSCFNCVGCFELSERLIVLVEAIAFSCFNCFTCFELAGRLVGKVGAIEFRCFSCASHNFSRQQAQPIQPSHPSPKGLE